MNDGFMSSLFLGMKIGFRCAYLSVQVLDPLALVKPTLRRKSCQGLGGSIKSNIKFKKVKGGTRLDSVACMPMHHVSARSAVLLRSQLPHVA